MSAQRPAWMQEIRWQEDGLVPVIAQDASTGRVLMFAYMSQEALALTVDTGEAHYWSRSRGRLWHKGEESGHVQRVESVRLDCDGDVLLLEIEQAGGMACHTGRERCFFRQLEEGRWVTTDPVLKDPADIYRASGKAEAGQP